MSFNIWQALDAFFDNSGGGGIQYGGTGTGGTITGNVTGGSGTGSSYPVAIQPSGTRTDPVTEEGGGIDSGDIDENGDPIYIDIKIYAPQLNPTDEAGAFYSMRATYDRLKYEFDRWLTRYDFYESVYGRPNNTLYQPEYWLYETYGEHFSDGHIHPDNLVLYADEVEAPPADEDSVGENSTGEVSSFTLRVTLGSSGNDSIQGSGLVMGAGGNDTVSGSSGSDILSGGDGNDVLSGGAGGDILYGGAGTDTVSYAGSAIGIVVNLATGIGSRGDATGDRLLDVENVVGSAHDDVIKVGTGTSEGFDAADYFAKNLDVATLKDMWGLGEDFAYRHWLADGARDGRAGGWAGISRGGGIDWGTHFDLAGYLAANPDILAYKNAHGLSDAWVVEHYFANGRHEGRAGALTASGAVIDAGAGHDFVLGGLYSDYVVGNTGSDTIYGYAGWDVLLGGTGRDVLWGGEGNDQIFGGNDDDFLSGESGDDTVEGGAGNDQVYGNAGDDVIRGNAGDDHLDGGEGAGRDSIDGGDGNDGLMGWDGDDLLRGEVGADTLAGGNGDDTLEGGAGNDLLWGGAGRDGFRFHAGDGSDTIQDFAINEWIHIEGTANVSFTRVKTVSWTGGWAQTGYDTIVTVDNQWQITLKGYGANLWWSAADHILIGY
ncbi:hypothetical protein DC522_16990 [Microvirga sp. KLBC 81]|uniref:calcium-binding protein n=1 Tax=Microvirga sp. KLBC 81 TaxID=1862707 RepID=UPI000D50AA69|nr:calcium-binding protein [Microvirga sp. KLBC 81]PVE23180.1 hypothetical protein DC522_16990 [Microvirga sp. KLBC 81]